MMWIGDMYAHGDGVKKDREEAMRWFRKIKDPVKRDDCPNVSVAAFLAYELSLRYKNEKKDDEAESWLNTAKTEGLDPKKCRIH
jgi:TPR repeat protein